MLIGINAYSQSLDEFGMKAAQIYHFTKFISWKSVTDTNAVFIIGVMGDSKIIPHLREISKNRKVKSKIIVIDKYVVNRMSAAKEINYCDILFVPKKYTHLTPKIVEIANENTLTIGESKLFAHKGGAINFVVVDDRLMFELNKKAIERRGFQVSPQLLKLAILVEDELE